MGRELQTEGEGRVETTMMVPPAVSSGESKALAESVPSGLIAGPGEALGIDEGLDDQDRVDPRALPVLAETTCGQRQDPRGQIRDVNPWQNQKSQVVRDPMKPPEGEGGMPSAEPST